MNHLRQMGTILALAAGAAFPIFLYADVTGADPRLTGAPGDGNCTSCHSGTALNGGGGTVKIILPGSATYTPGVNQHIQVQVSDPAQKRWGFEFTARLDSNPSNGQAGSLASTDGNTKVVCDTGRAAPCASASVVQFITHTSTGTRLGTTGSVIFEFDWTPPATDSGSITFYAAGNAANGNNSNSGDHIYTTSLSLTPAAAALKPSISSTRGVVNGASYLEGIAPNTWVTISGSNLSSTTRTWTAAEVSGGTLPTSLDGVSATINGKPAYVEYISPTQINVLAPDDAATGPVEVKVTSNGVTSDAYAATLSPLSPAFFTFDGKYVAATHADGSLVGKAGLFASAPTATTPARPGETIILYGTGFGPTSPAVTGGTLTSTLAPTSTTPTATIGSSGATVLFAGLIPSYAGLYQLNITVPTDAADGDLAIGAQIGGSSTPAAYVTVQK